MPSNHNQRIFDPYREEITALYLRGMPQEDIARKFGMSSGSVLICLRQAGVYEQKRKPLAKYMQPQYQPLVDEIVLLRGEGLSCPKIGAQVNVPASVVRTVLTQQGVARQSPRKLEGREEEVAALYLTGVSYLAVAKEFNVSTDTIHKIIKAQGAIRKIEPMYSGKEESIIALANEGRGCKEIGQMLKLSTNVVSRYLASVDLYCYPQVPHWWGRRHMIIAKYQEGIPVKRIAAELHTTVPILKECLVNQGCLLRSKFILEGKERDVEALYLQGMNVSKIAAHYQISNATVKKTLLRAGTPIRTSDENNLATSKANTPNAEFFDEIATEEQAYWLGFICADGSNDPRPRRYRLSIQLALCDKPHLQKFADLFNGKVGERTQTRESGERTTTAVYYLDSRYLTRSLAAQGVVQNKTYSPYMHLIPQGIDRSLLHHFVRGFIDGDGWAMEQMASRRSVRIGLAADIDLVGWLREYWWRELAVAWPSLTHKSSAHDRFYSVHWQHPLDTQKIYRWLYRDATVYLERKRSIFDTYWGYRDTSLYRGVGWDKKARKWTVAVYPGGRAGKTIGGGVFADEEIAARTYDRLALEHYGPQAALNFVESRGEGGAFAPPSSI